jgi:8-amino-7-oxononanoate synthase
MGCQGAVVVGSEILRSYLINFARSFIYTTALPQHCIDAILHGYQLLIETDQKAALQNNIAYFYSKSSHLKSFIPSQSGIHSVKVGNNEQLHNLERALMAKNIHARAMRSPTVKPGLERMRFSVHSYNTKEEIDLVFQVLAEANIK